MEQIFLLKIEQQAKLEKLLKWYREFSTSSPYIRNEIVAEHRETGRSLVGMTIMRLRQIVNGRPSEIPNLSN